MSTGATDQLGYAHRREARPGDAACAFMVGRAEGDRARAPAPANRMSGEIADFVDTPQRFARRPHVGGGGVHEARIAAVRVARGTDAPSMRDRDSSLFPELRTRDPFAAA